MALPLAALSLSACTSTGVAREAAPDASAAAPAAGAAVAAMRARPPEDEVVYFVLPDRFANGDPANDLGGYPADRLKSGFDPAAKGFYHGGDLKGLTAKLDYIQQMGVTAIWFAPIFKNKPVQGPKGDESAGYHGYWVTDFTQVDPHFGTNDDFRAFVSAAHARGIKVYMDIIVNHTADVIQYREGADTGFSYRSKADYPFSTRGNAQGAPINPGFMGDGDASPANWAKLVDPSFAYTPFVPEAEKNVKVPAWLNDPIYYHNRGNSNWVGESSLYGDFVGLDDVATENPRVVSGMIEIFGGWIDNFGIDGFRIDTARHVNPEFWQQFVPAMLARAKAKGIPHFHIFGEIAYEVPSAAPAAEVMANSGLPAALDMGFAKAAQMVVSGKASPQVMAELLQQDVLYPGGASTALQLPTFLGNHDFGRFSMFVKQANPDASDEELLARVELGHAMLLLLRGVPVIYYGDEQGFVSDGNDQLAREDMMPSKVAVYNDNRLLGTAATTADANFDTGHPLYRQVRALAEVRLDNPALTEGLTTIAAFDTEPGLLAVVRKDPASGQRVLLAFNTSARSIDRAVAVDYDIGRMAPLAGQCPVSVTAPGSARISLAAFGFAACELLPGDGE
ncbi:MAG: alpha-amylase [Sphingomonadales bacterium]|nr:alpha-amylase [Sphingomonadales bacterium]